MIEQQSSAIVNPYRIGTGLLTTGLLTGETIMTFYSTIARAAAGWRDARSAARTRRIIASLPSDIRKDIGWPDATDVDLRRGASSGGAQ
ncbi:MAG TPA: hypothetical protein GX405_12620 [Rhizobiales bacterium]|nr:hypothetical protein [Hyphomicrobiales bacterium]